MKDKMSPDPGVSGSGRWRNFPVPPPSKTEYRSPVAPGTSSYWVRPIDADGPVPER